MPILLRDRVDVDDHEFDGARALLAEHRGGLPAGFDAELERRRALAFTNHARLMRMVYPYV